MDTELLIQNEVYKCYQFLFERIVYNESDFYKDHNENNGNYRFGLPKSCSMNYDGLTCWPATSAGESVNRTCKLFQGSTGKEHLC